VQYKNILAMIFNEIKCHVNASLGLVGGMHPLHLPLCPRLPMAHFPISFALFWKTWLASELL